jgi:hypothetical protein
VDITLQLRMDASDHLIAYAEDESGSTITAAIEDNAADEVSRLRSLLHQGQQQLLSWHAKYGNHQPQWLPPAGDVQWLECVADALKGTPWERK